jgi:predicted metal-dependent peptidase
MNKVNEESLAKGIKDLMFEEPFYGLFLIGINKTWSDIVPTAGVSKNKIGVQLTINESFWEPLPREHKQGILKHEILHVAFGHITLRHKYPDHKLFNIAADIEINQYIKKDYLPDFALYPETFPELHLPKRAGTDLYYKLLQQAKDNGESETLNNLINQMEQGESAYDHSTWTDFEDLDEAEKKLIEKQIEHQLKTSYEECQKGRGTVPGELSEILKKILEVEPPKFDWRGYLRRFVGNSSVIYTKKLRRKQNKRYNENPGLKIKFKNHVLVAIDTSGSVSSEELKEFLGEINHIHKTGNMVTVVQCDTKLYEPEVFNPKKDFKIKGRGGTDFQPVIDYYNINSKKYTNLIYLTDGECNAPRNAPKKLLWVLSSNSRKTDHLPGYTIKLN